MTSRLPAAPVRRTATLLVAAAALGAAVTVAPPASADPADERYDNTFRKDFIMDAPWRVSDAATAIPLTIVLKDCDADDVRELHWIRCWDVTTGQTMLWDHDFGDELIGDDPHESNFWTYVTTVTEGHPSLPDGTPMTPASLGYAGGDAIDLHVEIYYRDDWFNYTETRRLRVHVGHGDYPWPDDWFGGDTHYHTMYTNNIAEFGAPLPAVALTGEAMGLHWLVVTDHSCDIDETGDGSYSYATTHWEYTVQSETGTETHYRDNTAIGTTWDVLGTEVALFGGPGFRLVRGVELNAASVDADTFGKTLHCLVMNDGYIDSPLSGAIGERPVTPPLPEALSSITGDGFAYAAHPVSDMNAEWGGIDWTINGTLWGDDDIEAALAFDAFRGLEAFNTRPTRYSSDQTDPWPDFDAGVEPDVPHPVELLEGIDLWDAYLRASLPSASLSPLRKVFLAGGSDAHGDFNYATYIGFDSYATDNAIGRVQTVVFVPGGYAPGSLPPVTEILAAYRAGRTIVTDGPFVEIGVDLNGDGDFADEDELAIGDDGPAQGGTAYPMTVRWASTGDFGPVTAVELIASDDSSPVTALSIDPSASGEGMGGERFVNLAAFGFEGDLYFRAECRTSPGGSPVNEGFRAYTNPVWIDFDATSVDAGDGADGAGPGVALAVGPNPFRGEAEVSFRIRESDRIHLGVYDIAGRLVSVLRAGQAEPGTHVERWDGTDARGRRVAAGVYLVRLQARGASRAKKIVLIR